MTITIFFYKYETEILTLEIRRSLSIFISILMAILGNFSNTSLSRGILASSKVVNDPPNN